MTKARENKEIPNTWLLYISIINHFLLLLPSEYQGSVGV